MADFNINTALQAVRERRTEASIREDQQRTEAGRGRLKPNGTLAERVHRARTQESVMRDELRFLRQQPNSELKSRRLRQVMDRIAELAAEQGDYTRAARIAFSPLRRERYKQIRKAIKINDEQNCECPPDLVIDRKAKQEIVSPAIMTIDTIVTPHGERRLDRCRKCGFMNARP